MEGLKLKISTTGQGGQYGPTTQATLNDVRTLNADARQQLRCGSGVELYLGKDHKMLAAKAALMAFSSVLQEKLTAQPETTGIQFCPDQVSAVAFDTVMDFIIGNTKTAKPFGLKAGSNLREAVQIYRFGRLLGWSKQKYLRGVFTYIRKAVTDPSGIISYGELDEIMQLPADDPVYRTVVYVFEHLRHKKQIEDIEVFENWVKGYPAFQHAMDEQSQKVKHLTAERRAKAMAQWIQSTDEFPALGHPSKD